MVERDDTHGIPLAIYGRASLDSAPAEQAAQMFEVTKASFWTTTTGFSGSAIFQVRPGLRPGVQRGGDGEPRVPPSDTYLFRGAYTREQLTARSNTIAHEMAQYVVRQSATMT
ncbi:MAG: aminopeptidase N, partial [Tetrasphaera sp.]|nr:aminopeptidase N [Tetrasphaera sp.]